MLLLSSVQGASQSFTKQAQRAPGDAVVVLTDRERIA